MRNIKRFVVVSATLSFVVGLAAMGCSAGPSTPHEPNTTVVHLGADGKPTVYRYYASPEQVARETAAKRAFLAQRYPSADRPQPAQPERGADLGDGLGQVSQAISQTGCAASDLWIYDKSGCNINDNRICFAGQGTANLWSYQFYYCDNNPPYYCFYVYWANNVKSYYPGTNPNGEDGYFTNYWGNLNYFYKGGSCTNTSDCAGLACDSVTLSN